MSIFDHNSMWFFVPVTITALTVALISGIVIALALEK